MGARIEERKREGKRAQERDRVKVRVREIESEGND